MDVQARWEQSLTAMREQFDDLLRRNQYEEIYELLQSNPVAADQANDFAIARVMLSVCEQEKEAGQCILLEKVDSLEEIVRRYTQLMFFLRRLEFDIMDDNMDIFNRFLKENQVSLQELFVVMFCGNINKEKVLQIVKDKIANGEIVL